MNDATPTPAEIKGIDAEAQAITAAAADVVEILRHAPPEDLAALAYIYGGERAVFAVRPQFAVPSEWRAAARRHVSTATRNALVACLTKHGLIASGSDDIGGVAIADAVDQIVEPRW